MDTTSDVILSFKNLFAVQPELAARLRHGSDLGSAAEALARIGAENGIPVNAAEIRRYVRAMMSSARPRDARDTHELSEASLDAVSAGGIGDPGAILLFDLLVSPPGPGGLPGRKPA